jgi:4-hydroxy-tetrahydrodipicolinate synthase
VTRTRAYVVIPNDRGHPAARETFLPWLPLVNFEAQVKIGLAIRKAS